MGLERKMIIPSDDKRRIRGTPACWQLERLSVFKDDPACKPYKYFKTVDSALHSAAQRELRPFPNTLSEAFDTCVYAVGRRAEADA